VVDEDCCVESCVVRAEDVVDSTSNMEEGPTAAEEEPTVCDEGIGVM
jgi:hypothetical protein